MPRRTTIATLLGAVLGGMVALAVLALAAARVIDHGVVSGDGGGVFRVGEGAMDLLIVVAGAAAGLVLGAIGYAVGKESSPDSPRVSLGPLLLLGAVVGAAVGFAIARAALGLAADRAGEIATVTVFRAALVALAAGGVTGAVIGGTVERLSRPEAFEFGGEAWPSSPVEFARDALRAMGLPALALVVGGAFVLGLSRVLLHASKEVALIVFGGVAAVVLFGAAFIASHPGDGGDS
ncbi:MAG: hypothetical protein KQH83_10710 [Actinobacteria bacterium]|nr:hypothetical protein [Actinomycetota bacterium]